MFRYRSEDFHTNSDLVDDVQIDMTLLNVSENKNTSENNDVSQHLNDKGQRSVRFAAHHTTVDITPRDVIKNRLDSDGAEETVHQRAPGNM